MKNDKFNFNFFFLLLLLWFIRHYVNAEHSTTIEVLGKLDGK